MKFFLVIATFLFASITVTVSAQTAGTVNGMKINVKEANKALRIITKGKKKWSELPAKGKKQLISMMAPGKLVMAAAKKSLTAKEKESALAGFWMQKKMAKMQVSDSEAKKAYDKMKKAAKAAKSKKKIPAFKAIKNSIKMQLRQEKIIAKLMKNAKIKIN